MDVIIPILGLLIGVGVGVAVGYEIRRSVAKKRTESAELRAEQLITAAKTKEKDLLLEAKEKTIKIIDEAKREEADRRKELQHIQDRLEKRETLFDQKLLDLESKNQKIEDQKKKFEDAQVEVQKIKEEQKAKLERIAALSKDEAKTILLDLVEKQEKDALTSRLLKLQKESSETFEAEAREMITTAIQRNAASQAQELTTTNVTLPSDEMKGRIIGREGRNIKAIEQLTGTEIIVDETPQAITVSGFSAIRRHIAKRALDVLIKDGRIQPARIEEAVEEAKHDIAIEIKKAGEEALYELGITGVDPKLVQILGRLKFRTSYGQNQLQHSIEVAHLSRILAEEVGADPVNAKKGGLFHDIGKAVDHEIQGTHPELGYSIMKKYGMPEEIAYHCIGHHEDHPKTLEAIIVKAADAISGSRPGARKDSYEQYIQRLEELEKITKTFPGIEKTYAIQAGREVRVFVTPQEIDDLAAHKLARDMATKIEQDLQYPGEIKVTVIRETRVIEYAR
ncbi:MAG: ribonuclease Y [Candidatus Yonathbacteria bacterium]|nr:ribonuclease Y [Candidatus Yonathbacteria bacterium]